MKQNRWSLCGSQRLQPLREIGLSEKTQCWDLEDIQAAIREAYALGIPVEALYGTGGGRAMRPGASVGPELPAQAN
jgi:hypothetical protein